MSDAEPPQLVALAEKIEGTGAEFSAMLDQIQAFETVLQPGAAVAHVEAQLKSTSAQLEKAQKRINHANQQFKKELDATVPADTWATRIQPVGADAHGALLGMICRHFERQGLASVAREMLSEDETLPKVDLGGSRQLQDLLSCLEADAAAESALLTEWLAANRDALEWIASPLPVYITELKFFQVLVTRGDADALVMLRDSYSTNALPANTIERLAGSIPLYGTLSWTASQAYIENLRHQATVTLINNFWQIYPGAVPEDYLVDALEASAVAFPVLDRLGKVLAMTPWSSKHELPAEVALPAHLQFHPIFVCPVLKEQSGDTPPKLLPCGHVLSADAFTKLSKSQSHVYIKCPYCPKSFGLPDVRDVRFIRKKVNEGK